MAHRSWSVDSTGSSIQPSHATSSGLSTQKPFSTEELWDTYFNGSILASNRVKAARNQRTILQGDGLNGLHISFTPERCLPCQPDKTDHSITKNAPSVTHPMEQGFPARSKTEEPHYLASSTNQIVSTEPDEPESMTRKYVLSDKSDRGHPKRLENGRGLLSRQASSNSVMSASKESCQQAFSMKVASSPEAARAHNTGESTQQSQEGFLVDLKHETDSLLRVPMMPIRSDSLSDDGFPLGVEKARMEYDQGLLSTATFVRDCLPPLLVCSKVGTSAGKDEARQGLSITQPASSESALSVPYLSVPHQPDGAAKDDTSPVARQRNAVKEQQLRRINQAPLSAIYEESDGLAGTQHECPCKVCTDMANGRGIVWFHLCPRYRALALENGIKYQPYEGRVILHHERDKSSLGLIIEGPMEERFVPVIEPTPRAATPARRRARAPRPANLDLQSLHPAACHTTEAVHHSTSPSKPPPVLTPALQRPISPTQVSGPTSLNPHPTLCYPQSPRSKEALTANGEEEVDKPDSSGVIEAESVHPAFRAESSLPTQWTTPPTRSLSRASFDGDSPSQPPSAGSARARLSIGSSDLSGLLPVRSDSLGAPTHPGPVKPSKNPRGHQRPGLPSPLRQQFASRFAEYDDLTPLVSPSAGHEHTPSEYLCPSTPSTASCKHSSLSSEVGAPFQTDQGAKDRAGKTRLQEARSPDPAVQNPDSVHDPSSSVQSSSQTARGSYGETLPLRPQHLTARTAPSSLDHLRSNNPRGNSPYFQTRGHHRSQASNQSTTQSFSSQHYQSNSDPVSGTTLLNGTAFDSADETSHSGAEDPERPSAEYDLQQRLHEDRADSRVYRTNRLLTGAAEARRADYLSSSRNFHTANSRNGAPTIHPLHTVGATEAHYTDIVTSPSNNTTQYPNRRASVALGEGIATAPTSIPPHHRTSSCINNSSSGNNTAAAGSTRNTNSNNSDLDSYLSSHHSYHRHLHPPRRSLLVQQNLCSHIKLQDVLFGADSSSSPAPIPTPTFTPASIAS
ncbi:MAG: hypothetical protein LQ348_005332, partial [Seirophora lacunosa]